MTKRITMTPSPRKPANTADEWIDAGATATPTSETLAAATDPNEPMRRLTIDIPESLHRKIKATCAQEGKKMSDVLRAMLEERYQS